MKPFVYEFHTPGHKPNNEVRKEAQRVAMKMTALIGIRYLYWWSPKDRNYKVGRAQA